MSRDKVDNQRPDDEDQAELEKIRQQQQDAADWEAENPDPKR